MVQIKATKNALHELGYKIFLDRYAQKDMNRTTLTIGDTVIVVVNGTTGQREIGKITQINGQQITIELLDGEVVTRDIENVDKPLETDPAQMMDRVAHGIAQIEASDELRAEWAEKFRWLLDDFKFVPAGRILAAAGTDQLLTYYNCYVVPSPRDSRGGIIETLRQMTEIMSRGGGVGINISSLRPRHAYVKGVNGRSSGSVSWGALYSFVTGLIEQGGSRRGALMLILNDWHPDIYDFINSKRTAGKITNANISVGISDRFMDAVKADADWDLLFPDSHYEAYDAEWDGQLELWQSKGYPVITYKTVKARDIWNALIESAWASAEPGVWFRERANKMSNSSYYSNGILIATNPCGEQSLSAWAVCNLGAINLAKFYDDANQDVKWDDLDRAVRYATRFLDDVIDSTPYFFEENANQQLGERRVGLNNMGLAELMIKLGIRYGSDESVAFIDKLYSLIARASYETSAELASEKGAFPMFDAEKFLQSGFMQTMPDDVRTKIREQGIRNVTLLTQAPTGCVAPDTLISTSTGMQAIGAMGNVNGMQWQIMTRDVHTDVGLRKTSHFFINGFAAVKKITTKRGFSITATHNHRIRVIDATGDYVWRRMDEVQAGDTVVMKKNTLGDGDIVDLTPVSQGNRALSQLPTRLTPEFAEMLGLYMGDGYTKKRGGMHIVVADKDADLLDYIPSLLRSIWGDRHVSIEKRVGCSTVNLTGYYIRRFLEANGMLKPSGNHGEGAAGAFIPAKVLQGGRLIVAPFLRGLFETDGSISRGTVTYVSTSQTLVKQMQIALLGLGIVATLRTMPEQENRYGDRPIYELRLLNRREVVKFVEQIGFISERKRAKAAQIGAISDRGDSIDNIPLLQNFYATSQGLNNDTRQRITGLVSNGALTQQFVKEMTTTHPQMMNSRLGELVSMDMFLDQIVSIEDGESHTYDLSVPDNHTYIANGFVSHNTTGTMVNTSTGIEPFFSWVYYRKSRLGLHEEQVPLVKEWYDANPGATELPEYFITAMDLSPTEHVKVQAAIQRWVDSSISKTANLPNSYTIDQTRELYEYMYELGCKGGTVYRDGSRDEQVLMLKKDLPKAEAVVSETAEITQVATPHYVYPRPNKLNGVTVVCKTPYGTAYVTMNSDENGYPFEVFITAPGKAGSDLQADAEGLGRMISLQLRTTAPQNRLQMLKLVIDQLQGIGGSRSIGMGPKRVTSLPDALAGALMDQYFPQDRIEQLSMFAQTFDVPIESFDVPSVTAPTLSNGHAHDEHEPNGNGRAISSVKGYARGAEMCPSCGTMSLLRVEGCKKCEVCGFSEC